MGRIKKEHKLFDIAEYLRNELDKNGFPIDKKPFSPHITIAREIVSDSPISLSVKETDMTVNKISLMRSDRINGKLTYTEIYSKNL